jgi:hypothetical protein
VEPITRPVVWYVVHAEKAIISSQDLMAIRLVNQLFSLMAAMHMVRIKINILEDGIRSLDWDVRHFLHMVGSLSSC